MTQMRPLQGGKTTSFDLSIVILTLNEADRIQRCIESLPEGAEIIVFDSFSADDTIAKAKKLGAKTFTRAFTNYAEQRNEALKKATGSWVLMVDADEYLSADLKQYLQAIYHGKDALPGKYDAYAIKRRLIFLGRRMRWGKSADRPIRLLKRGAIVFEGHIHESANIAKHRCGLIAKGHLWHESYRDLSDYFTRFNRYTSAIARQHFLSSSHKPLSFLSHLFRPWVEFISRYVLRLGFLDGYAGYTYALISSLYAYVKYAKLYELDKIQQKEKGR